jgi:tetratricopeptide (TPR) repeat protein
MMENRNRARPRYIPVFFTVLLLVSCQSLQQDLFIPVMNETGNNVSIAALEETIVRLEASPASGGVSAARKKIGELEKESVPDNSFQAVLAAWSGRLAILEGKPAEAQRELKRSRTLAPDNWPAAILAARLEQDGQKRLAVIDEVLEAEGFQAGRGGTVPEGSGELQIEKGRALLELNRFAEAAAAFDLAFSLLEAKPFYREMYSPARNRAFELKDIADVTGSKTVELVQQDGVTWKDLVEITKTETNLLRFLTAGRDWSAEEIFGRLVDRAFIPYTQDVTLTEWPEAKPKSGEEVLRSGAAWFIWHLYAENWANRGLLSRYSSRYANNPNVRSPIEDLPLLSPFFDSILGCVETEFMALPDGKKFVPEEKLRGPLFLAMLKKLEP